MSKTIKLERLPGKFRSGGRLYVFGQSNIPIDNKNKRLLLERISNGKYRLSVQNKTVLEYCLDITGKELSDIQSAINLHLEVREMKK